MAIHDVQQLSPYVPQSRVLWVFVDGDRENRACLPCAREEDIPAKIEAYVVELDRRDHDSTAPKTYSKLRLYGALTKAQLWNPLKAWLEQQSIDGMNAWEAFTLAQDLTSDHYMFAAFLTQAQTALGVTDEQVAAVLAAAELKDGE